MAESCKSRGSLKASVERAVITYVANADIKVNGRLIIFSGANGFGKTTVPRFLSFSSL
jgi:ABC-type multidrug transport system ATPase subunit